MSSPHVAGVVALVKSIHPDLTALEVRNIIENTATPVEPAFQYGKGIVNANRAVREAMLRLSPSLDIAN